MLFNYLFVSAWPTCHFLISLSMKVMLSAEFPIDAVPCVLKHFNVLDKQEQLW